MYKFLCRGLWDNLQLSKILNLIFNSNLLSHIGGFIGKIGERKTEDVIAILPGEGVVNLKSSSEAGQLGVGKILERDVAKGGGELEDKCKSRASQEVG